MTNINVMSIFLGEYEVVERKDQIGAVSIALAKNIHLTVHIPGLPVSVKPGDKLPLFTQIPYNTEPFDALFGKPSKQ